MGLTEMHARLKPLPELAFGEQTASVCQDLESYRQQLSRAVPGLKTLDARGGEPFQFKASTAVINGTTIIASANSAIGGHIGTTPMPVVQLILSGTSVFTFEGRTYRCPSGSIVYIPEYERDGECDARSLLTLSIDRLRLLDAYEAIAGKLPDAAVAAELSRFILIPPSDTSARILDKILAISRVIDLSLENQRALNILALDDVLHRLVALAIWPMLWTEPQQNGYSAANVQRLRAMEEYIRQHLNEPLQITALARHVGISARLVHQLFMKEHGVTPTQWIRNLRLDHARALLMDRHSALRVRHIAAQCGFAKPGLFSASYRQRFGETPVETRNRFLRGV